MSKFRSYWKHTLIFLGISGAVFTVLVKADGDYILEGPEKTYPYSITFLGDTGTGDTNQGAVARAMYFNKSDEYRVLGDVIYEGGLASQYDPQFRTKFHQHYAVFKKPFWIVLGNHDYVHDKAGIDAWLDIGRRIDYVNFPNLYYFEKYGDLCILSLDTFTIAVETARKIFKDKTPTQLQQEKWLKERIFPMLSKCNIKIALGHHPYRSHGFHGDMEMIGKRFFEEYILGRFDFYFAGHDHNLAYEGQAKGTHLIVSGGGGKTRSVKQGAPYIKETLGFSKMIIDKDKKVKIEFYEVDRLGGQKKAYELNPF